MHLGVDHKTTWFGAAGEGLKALAVFVPAPFNLIPLALGACCSAIAFFFAQDRTMPDTNAKPHVEITKVEGKHLVALLVASGVLMGCTNTKEATRLLAHGSIDGACSVAHRAVDVGFGPVNDLEHDVYVTVEMVTGDSKPK